MIPKTRSLSSHLEYPFHFKRYSAFPSFIRWSKIFSTSYSSISNSLPRPILLCQCQTGDVGHSFSGTDYDPVLTTGLRCGVGVPRRSKLLKRSSCTLALVASAVIRGRKTEFWLLCIYQPRTLVL